MTCCVENCINNTNGYCDIQSYITIDQNGNCDDMDIREPTDKMENE